MGNLRQPTILGVLSRRTFALSVLVVLVVHAASATLAILAGGLNVDEGFYGVAARAVARGQLPYRDFGYPQSPLLPFINGLMMRLLGFGLFPQRLANGLWGATALGLAAWLVGRRTQPWVGFAFAILFSLSMPWMYGIHLGKTQAFATLAVMGATWAFLHFPAGRRRQWTLAVCTALGIGCRLSSAPFLLALWLASLGGGEEPNRPSRLGSTLALLACLSLVFAPFFLQAPEATWFWIFQFQALSVQQRGWHLGWLDLLSLAPLLWLVSGGVVALVLWRRETRPRREFAVAIASLLALAMNLGPRGAYLEYGIPYLLPLATALFLIAAPHVRGWARARKAWLVGGLLVVHATANPILNYLPPRSEHLSTSSLWLSRLDPDYDFHLHERHLRIRALVKHFLPPTQPFVGSNLIPALDADRPVPAKLMMGPFSVTRELDPARADLLHLAQDEDLVALLADPRTTLVSFTDRPEMNYGWSMPSFRTTPVGTPPPWTQGFLRDFTPILYEGHYFIFVRRDAIGAPRAPTGIAE